MDAAPARQSTLASDVRSRARLQYRWSADVRDAGEFDVVVVGGGLAGYTAAVTAARLGAATVLIQNRPVLGGNASTEILVPPVGVWPHRKRDPLDPRETGLVEEYRTEGNQTNAEAAVYSARLLRWVQAEPNLTLCLNTHATGVPMRAGQPPDGPGAGVAAAAIGTVPGDALYAVKTFGEDFHLALTADEASEFELDLAFEVRDHELGVAVDPLGMRRAALPGLDRAGRRGAFDLQRQHGYQALLKAQAPMGIFDPGDETGCAAQLIPEGMVGSPLQRELERLEDRLVRGLLSRGLPSAFQKQLAEVVNAKRQWKDLKDQLNHFVETWSTGAPMPSFPRN